MNLNAAIGSPRRAAKRARAARPGVKLHRDPAARVNAFADRLLYDGWLEDNRRDRMKLVMIRAIVEWAQDRARN
jgi:hypothetical protein